MVKETMTLHKALSELKILEDRINDKINETTFCAVKTASAKKINGITEEEFKTNVKGDYDSIIALINRRNAIKRAVSDSNAQNKVKINDKEYSIAEAIEMKKFGMDNYRFLLNTLKRQYTTAVSTVERQNAKADEDAVKYVQNMFKSDNGNVPSEAISKMDEIRQSYFDSHKTDIVTPLKIKDVIDSLEKQIADFTANVDDVLACANAMNTITIEY